MTFTNQDKQFMQRAIQLAKHAEGQGEVPVGAIMIFDNEIIGEGWNCPISRNDPTSHAEMIVLRSAAANLQNYRLLNTTLYVTLEPCLMCAGAMIHARIKRLVFGAHDPKAGAAGSILNVFEEKQLNHTVIYEGGLLAKECSVLLKDFFRQRRN